MANKRTVHVNDKKIKPLSVRLIRDNNLTCDNVR